MDRTRSGVTVAAFTALTLSGILGSVGGARQDSPGAGEAGVEFFEKRIRPVLSDRCYSCHSQKAEKLKGNLALDTSEGILRGGESGAAIVPGEPGGSLLIKAVRYADEDLRMPPKSPLSPSQVAELEQWIRLGAPMPAGSLARPAAAFWSFLPPGEVKIPEVRVPGWPSGDIDSFILARLESSGLAPAPDADRRTLIRRATFDLIGLPPTPGEVEDFVADPSPDAYPKLLDRLLAMPQYGERWGRHWLDVVRYADSGGFEADPLYPNAWRYRDYVIRSLNSDKPFDRFVQEQVAGDELWPKDGDAAIATGLYCIGPALEESAMMSRQLEYEWLTDAVDTTATAFLGLSLGCARCHDHKYDPIKQKDYFALQAIFAPSDRPFPGKFRLQRIKMLNGILADSPVPKEALADRRCTVKTEDQVGFGLFHRDEPFVVHRLQRGELSKPREMTGPGIPPALLPAGRSGDAPFSESTLLNRRAVLARWLTSRENPLTARVAVNRVWRWHFGQAIVRTPNDFGRQGEAPTHPELLDWLARDFMDHGWSLKQLHRRIMTSRTYTMASAGSGKGLMRDPENRLLWHFPRHRLEGEAIRDSILACAGTLNRKAGGPAVAPPLTQEELTGLFQPQEKWPLTKEGSEYTRRSVYLLSRRTFPYPFLASFDPPEVMTSCPQRAHTTVPAQALTLLNSPLAREQAAAFAKRLLEDSPDDPGSIVTRAWGLALGRGPTAPERGRALAFLRARSLGASVSLESALGELCLALFNATEFITIE